MNFALAGLGGFAGEIPGIGSVVSAEIGMTQEVLNYMYDLEQVQAQIDATEIAIADEQYAGNNWGDFVVGENNRDLIIIEDFQLGVDNIILPQLNNANGVTYQMTAGYHKKSDETNFGGTVVSIKDGTNDAEDFLFVKNNDDKMNDSEFTELLLDLVTNGTNTGTGEGSFGGTTISTYSQTRTTSQAISVGETTELFGNYAGNVIEASEYTGKDTQESTGTYLMVGQYGDDVIIGASKDDYIEGGFNDDNDDTPFIYEDDGYDLLLGRGGNDTLDGGTGNDSLDGGVGNDILYGEEGSDTAVYLNATSGIRADLYGRYDSQLYRVYTEVEDDGLGGSDRLYDVENIIGSDYNDYISKHHHTSPSSLADNSESTLEGGGGNDTLFGGAGADYLDGGEGNDSLWGGAHAISDTLIGGKGNDTLRGNFGDDYLEGGSGNDTLDGGNDSDTVSYQNVGYTLTQHGLYRGTRIELNTGNGYHWYGEGDNQTDIKYTDQLSNIENVVGSPYIDTILGNDQNNVLNGLEDNDFLKSFGGDDTLIGGSGQDSLFGGADNDTLTGGSDADIFVFNAGSGIDTITDFKAAELDKIWIDKSVYGIGDINSVSFNDSTNQLSVNNSVIAILDNQVGFDVSSHVTLIA